MSDKKKATKKGGEGGGKKSSRYKAALTREKNKLKRIVRSNGIRAAQAYADKYGLQVFVKPLIARREARST